MRFGQVILLFSLLIFSMPSFSGILDDMTQKELRDGLVNYKRCILPPANSVAEQSGKEVSMIQVLVTTEEAIYFVEVGFPGSSEKTIFYLPKTHLTLGGYKSVGSRSNYLGISISGSVNYLSQTSGGTGVDASVSISDHLLSSEEKFYNYCEF